MKEIQTQRASIQAGLCKGQEHPLIKREQRTKGADIAGLISFVLKNKGAQDLQLGVREIK